MGFITLNKDWPFIIQLSFAAITDTTHQQIPAESAVLEHISDEQTLQQHEAEVSHLLEKIFPQPLTTSEIKAACIPFTDLVFNHTMRFKKILHEAGPGFQFSVHDHDAHHSYIACCCLILNKYYNAHIDLQKPLFQEIPAANGISKFYRVLYNTQFIEVLPMEKAIPITPADIERLVDNYEDIQLWKDYFPAKSWLVKGFAIMTLIDVTVENAVSLFKEKLLALQTANFKESITTIFRSVFLAPGIEVGFTIFQQPDGRLQPALFNGNNLSMLLPAAAAAVAARVLGKAYVQVITGEHKKIIMANVPAILETDPGNHLAALFHTRNFKSIILAPVVKNSQLVGILEVASPVAGELNSVNAQKLEAIMPFLAEAIERLITRFQLQAEAVIQEYFTAIHPAVKWKFLQEAEKWLSGNELGHPSPMADILLKNVQPFYGQIDIKGSSHTRNEQAKKDLIKQLLALLTLLTPKKEFEEDLPLIKSWLSQLQTSFPAGVEEMIDGYLHTTHNRLSLMNHGSQQAAWESYRKEADIWEGAFHTNRRTYQQTIKQINKNLAAVLQQEQAEAQKICPHYFELYKTDGVEHVLYAGRSIAPHAHVDRHTISQLRLWQLQTMCKMEKAHRQLLAQLPYPLEVTSLVLAYQHSIDLRFRVDEKHFDVDGAYNVRFEVLKKRIDKARIKNSEERITVPGKLAIVYTNEQDEKDYIAYLAILAEQGWIEKDHEIIEVQDLQDVAGLRAIRAGFI